MSRKIGTFLTTLIGLCASTVLASAQATSSLTENQASSPPVAYVYVSDYVSSSGTYQVNGFAAAANGALTPIAGSPFPDSLSYLVLNGSWLFGIEASASGGDQNVDSYSIAPNGALTFAQRTQVNDTGGGPTTLLLDHTGSSLYVNYYSLNNDCLTYSIDQSSGALTYVSTLNGGPGTGCAVSFTGTNQFAYSSSCYHFTPLIYGDARASDGSLSWMGISPALPTPPSGDVYCPYLAAADPYNHLAVAVQPVKGGIGPFDGPAQLAVYTADSSGNLTTNSTYLNMPATLVQPTDGNGSLDYWMSPSGRLLAVGGPLGLQVFHFNGANPITHFTGLLTKNEVDQVFWDNANHLYAISRSAGKLYVFTVTPTSVTQAPGSPHSIPGAQYEIVLPKT